MANEDVHLTILAVERPLPRTGTLHIPEEMGLWGNGRLDRSGPWLGGACGGVGLSARTVRPTGQRAVVRPLGVGEGVCHIDIACGSGFAAHLASERNAQVSGLDAAEALVAIARARTPTGGFRVGDMFELPFADNSFDVATSFNGIWKGCEGALSEARRVLVPEGRLGLTFWGRASRMGLMPYFAKMIELSPPDHSTASMEQGDTGRRGVMEDMLAATGFELVERGTVDVVNEWPDVGTAVRALAAAGPCVPAIEVVGYEAFCDALREVISPLWDRDVGVRITSEFGWTTAKAA
jgi:SAM-dependent methyltransferase